MQTQIISATKARQEFFSLLNALKSGQEFTIHKDNVAIGKLVPMVSDSQDWKIRKKELLKTLDETRGAWKNVKFNSPFRGKKASKWLSWEL